MTNLCWKVEASCHCIEPIGHEGPHVCDCRGSWEYDAEGLLVPVIYPGGDATLGEALARIWGDA